MGVKEKGKGFLTEFKNFALRGSVIDLAVGVIIGAAFQTIVNSLVKDIIMPLVSIIFNVNFESWKWTLRDAVLEADGVTVIKEAISVNYGLFISTVINFAILAFVIFLMVKAINKMRQRADRKAQVEEVSAPPEPSAQEKLLAEIRDLLRAQI